MNEKLDKKVLNKAKRDIKKLVVSTKGLEEYVGVDVRWELYQRFYDEFEHEDKDNKQILNLLKEEAKIKYDIIMESVKSEKEQNKKKEWTGLPTIEKRRGAGQIDNFKGEESEFQQVSREALQSIMRFMDAEICDTPEEFAEACLEFFEGMFDRREIPTIEKLALALGYTNETLGVVRNGSKGHLVAQIVNKAYQIIGAYDTELASQGKMNPTIYIFRSKNFYGLRDETTHVVIGDENAKALESQADIRARIIEDLPLVDED